MTSSYNCRGRGPALNHGSKMCLVRAVVQNEVLLRNIGLRAWNAERGWAPTVQCLAPLM